MESRTQGSRPKTRKTSEATNTSVLPKKMSFFQLIDKILTIQKIVLSSSRRQGNFRGLEASRLKTSKCVLEDSTSDRMIFEISAILLHQRNFTLTQPDICTHFTAIPVLRTLFSSATQRPTYLILYSILYYIHFSARKLP